MLSLFLRDFLGLITETTVCYVTYTDLLHNDFFRTQTKSREGNVFTGACFCPGGPHMTNTHAALDLTVQPLATFGGRSRSYGQRKRAVRILLGCFLITVRNIVAAR